MKRESETRPRGRCPGTRIFFVWTVRGLYRLAIDELSRLASPQLHRYLATPWPWASAASDQRPRADTAAYPAKHGLFRRQRGFDGFLVVSDGGVTTKACSPEANIAARVNEPKMILYFRIKFRGIPCISSFTIRAQFLHCGYCISWVSLKLRAWLPH